MSSIGPPAKRNEVAPESASSKAQAEGLAQRRIDDEAHAALFETASHYDGAPDVHLSGNFAEGTAGEMGLEPPDHGAESRAEGPEAHRLQSAASNATLATQLEHALERFSPRRAGLPTMPNGEAADAQALGQQGPLTLAARQRSLQQGQQGFVVPLPLRRPRRVAYTERADASAEVDWDVDAIEALIGTLHVSVGSGMQTHDDPAMRKERRFRRWLVILAHRRRIKRRAAPRGKK